MKTRLCIALALASAGALAADVLFRPSGGSYDLASSTNYDGSQLPATGDRVIVDLTGVTSGVTFSLGADLEIGGLVVSNANVDLTFESANSLTLGADGLTILRPEGTITTYPMMRMKMPLATTSAATWNFGWMKSEFYSTFTGTSDLTITGCFWVQHMDRAPEYGGLLYYYDNGWIECRSSGSSVKWARRARFYRGQDEGNAANGGTRLKEGWDIRWVPLNATLTLEDAFPEGFEIDNLDYYTPTFMVRGYDELTLGTDDAISHPRARVFLNTEGNHNRSSTLVVDGGSIAANELHAGFSDWNGLVQVKNGTVAANYITVGNIGSNLYRYRQAIEQTGGDVTCKRLGFGWGWTGPDARVEYVMNGGTLTTETGSDDCGVLLSWRHNDRGVPGFFRMENGTVNAHSLAISPNWTNNGTWDTVVRYVQDGGTFNLGSGGIAAHDWNYPAKHDTNGDNPYNYAGHRVEFKDGTLAVASSTSSDVPLCFSGTNATVSVSGGASFSAVAPIYGKGKLVKTGNGRLVLSDATEFTGELEVQNGTVAFYGASDGGVYCWRADDAVPDGAVGGESVASISDVNQGARIYRKDGTAPTLALNAFNGHAGLAFNKSTLYCPKEYSPAANQTKWTAVVVFKTSSEAAVSTSGGDWYNNCGILGYEQGGLDLDWGLSFGGSTKAAICGGAGFKDGTSGNADYHLYSHADAQHLADGNPHVAVYVVDGATMRVTVDGLTTERVTEYVGSAAHNDVQMLIGCQAQGDIGKDKSFVGTIAEIRSYRGTALTADQAEVLCRELDARYGGTYRGADVSAVIPSGSGSFPAYSKTVADLSTLGGVSWKADSLDATHADGDSVPDWTSEDGAHHARRDNLTDFTFDSNGHAPTLVKNAINGHSAVRFDSTGAFGESNYRQALGIPADDSPLSGATNFTVAVVFRSSTETENLDANCFWLGASLLNTEHGGSAVGDFGMTLHKYGRASLGAGGVGNNEAVDRNAQVVPKAFNLYDGRPHVMIYTFKIGSHEDGVLGENAVMVDGLAEMNTFDTPPVDKIRLRGNFTVTVGSIYNDASTFYNGEIAAIRMYDRALGYDEMKALSDAYCEEYGIERVRTETGATGLHGLAAGTVRLGENGVLMAKSSVDQPLTLRGATRLCGAGRVEGALAIKDGATLDVGEGLYAEDLRIGDGGVLAFATDLSQPMEARDVSLSGRIKVDVSRGATALPGNVVVLRATGSLSIAEGTTFVLDGEVRNAKVRVNAESKTVSVGISGFILIVR